MRPLNTIIVFLLPAILRAENVDLTYRAQGRDYRLTDVHGNVVRKILV